MIDSDTSFKWIAIRQYMNTCKFKHHISFYLIRHCNYWPKSPSCDPPRDWLNFLHFAMRQEFAKDFCVAWSKNVQKMRCYLLLCVKKNHRDTRPPQGVFFLVSLSWSHVGKAVKPGGSRWCQDVSLQSLIGWISHLVCQWPLNAQRHETWIRWEASLIVV